MNAPRKPDRTNELLDPDTCEVLEGHQHAVANIEELAESIAIIGQLNPIQVIEHGDGRRLIAAGRRRWMACKSRGLPLRADVWVSDGEDITLEHLARSMRIAENVQRHEPSAMDVAIQMRHIRSEHGFRNAAELGAHLGMHEARVKRYLSVFQGGDFLLEECQQHSLPLATVLELVKLEKQAGAASTRRVIQRVVKGELGCEDIKRMRVKTTRAKRTAKPKAARGPQGATPVTSLRAGVDAVLQAVQSDPEGSRELARELFVSLDAYLQGAAA